MVYETRGVRPAARELKVTHSAISRHVRQLEAWVGTPLLQRTQGSRALVFTAAGHALGEVAIASFAELAGAVEAIRERRDRDGVTLATTPSIAARWLLPRLASFESCNPHLELSITVDQRVLAPGDVGADLAVRIGEGSWPGLRCEPLMDDRLFPVMSPEFFERNGRPSSPDDLARLRLLHDRDPHASWALIKRHFDVPMLDVRSGSRYTASDLVLGAAEHGLGVALARERLAESSLEQGALMRPFTDIVIKLPRAYWLVTNDKSGEYEQVSRVRDWLREVATAR